MWFGLEEEEEEEEEEERGGFMVYREFLIGP